MAIFSNATNKRNLHKKEKKVIFWKVSKIQNQDYIFFLLFSFAIYYFNFTLLCFHKRCLTNLFLYSNLCFHILVLLQFCVWSIQTFIIKKNYITLRDCHNLAFSEFFVTKFIFIFYLLKTNLNLPIFFVVVIFLYFPNVPVLQFCNFTGQEFHNFVTHFFYFTAILWSLIIFFFNLVIPHSETLIIVLFLKGQNYII